MEMHLAATSAQRVRIPTPDGRGTHTLNFTPGETIHTENSYKFTPQRLATLLLSAGFTPTRTWNDPQNLFAVTLATV